VSALICVHLYLDARLYVLENNPNFNVSTVEILRGPIVWLF